MGSRFRTLMFQEWCDLTFLHWRWDASELARRLPKGLELELFDRSAWLGLTPFHLRRLRAPGLPPLPWISYFPEINLRTYVRGPDRVPGIWFFSLECARLAAVLGARATYGLPYRWARMRVHHRHHEITYRRRRYGAWTPESGATLHARIAIGRPLAAGPLETFLTARTRLYTLLAGRHLGYADVEHAAWPLHSARVLQLEAGLCANLGFPVGGQEPLVHFSPGVKVRVGAPGRFGAHRG